MDCTRIVESSTSIRNELEMDKGILRRTSMSTFSESNAPQSFSPLYPVQRNVASFCNTFSGTETVPDSTQMDFHDQTFLGSEQNGVEFTISILHTLFANCKTRGGTGKTQS